MLLNIGKTAVDLNSATGCLLGAVLAFAIFCTKEEGYPLKTNTDDRCFFSPATCCMKFNCFGLNGAFVDGKKC